MFFSGSAEVAAGLSSPPTPEGSGVWVNKQHLLEKKYLRRYGRKILLE